MVSKNEYQFVKTQIKNLEDKLFDFEFKSDLYAKWMRFLDMSVEQKQKLHSDWTQYYQKCHDGYYGQMARKVSAHFTLHADQEQVDMAKALIKEMNESHTPYNKQPSSIDPDELEMKMQGYFTAKRKLVELKRYVGEYDQVYEQKGEMTI